MGKARRNKDKGNRSDPLSKPVKPPTDPELAALREQKILPIIAKLRDAPTQAVSDVASIVTDERCRKLLLRERIVHVILRDLVANPSLQNKAAGWSILRNLALEEDLDFSVHLYRQDVLTAMENAARVVSDALSGRETPYIKTTKFQKYYIREIYTSLTPLAEQLSAARHEIKDAIASHPMIVGLFFQLATSSDVEEEAAADALHSLWRLSESNRDVVELILCDNKTRIYKTLRVAQTGTTGPRAICSSAVLHNIYDSMGWHDRNPGPLKETDALNVQTVNRVLRGTDVEAALRDRGDRWQRRLTLIEVGLEVLASIATTYQETLLDDGEFQGPSKPSARKKDTNQESVEEFMADGYEEEEWNGFDDSEDEMMVDVGKNKLKAENSDEPLGDMDMGDIEVDMDAVTGHADDDTYVELSDLPTLEGLFQILPDVAQLATGFWKGEERDKERIENIRSNAIDAINNIAWTAASFDFGEPQNEDILRHWVPLAKMVWEKVVLAILSSDTDDVGLASMVTGIAWALFKSVGGDIPLGPNVHRKFIGLYEALRKMDLKPENGQPGDPWDTFQHPGVKCIGVLGSIARDPAPLGINKEIFAFLLNVILDQATLPAALVEALNQVMNIYADEETNCETVFWAVDGGVLEMLEKAHTHARKMIKKVDRRNEPELREQGDQTLMNFLRFIKYKTKQRPRAA